MPFFLGVDTGGSKSHALLADEQGHVVGFGEGGPGNWESVGWAGTRSVLADIIDQVIAQSRVEPGDIAAAGFGLAGYDWPEDRQPHVDIVRGLLVPNLPFELVNDAFIGLWAGADAGWGVVVSAGTSCNCWGRNAQGATGRVTGSSRFGEYAGASELVWWAVQAVARAWSQRGPETRLSDAFREATGAVDVADLLAGLMRRRYVLWADRAPLVFDVAAHGDPVALELVRRTGRELGELALGVSRQIGVTSMAFDVVLSGSLYDGSPLVEQAMAETIHAVAPRANLVRLEAPPVVGAVLLGMEHVGLQTATIRETLIASTDRWRHRPSPG
ncbi:MAG: BadF/BadG/BcrA/BcrD ATPase family protein [Anaerolineae bacterium]|jgi:N-acetylglucosamine kinase-like BadF-type ATPase